MSHDRFRIKLLWDIIDYDTMNISLISKYKLKIFLTLNTINIMVFFDSIANSVKKAASDASKLAEMAAADAAKAAEKAAADRCPQDHGRRVKNCISNSGIGPKSNRRE